MIQPGMHPDAEILTAFAEQLVTEAERQQVLAHMALCDRCREVVFLAQQAAEPEQPASVLSHTSERKMGGGWFTGWRLFWVPVAALAGIVGFAVVQHQRHGSVPESQMAQNAPPPEPMRDMGAAKAAPSPEPPQQPQHSEARQKAATRERSDKDAVVDSKSLDEKNVAPASQKKDLAKEAESLSSVASNVPGGAVHGTFRARAKTAIGGPLLQNQMQAQNNVQTQQNYTNEDKRSSPLADSANKPVSAPLQTGSTAQTVAVDAEAAPVPVSPAPSAAPAVPRMEVDTLSAGLTEGKLAKAKPGRSALPSKLEVRSSAIAGQRVVAIDAAGALFQSEDAGRHWQAVKAQWTGRPVQVKVRPTISAVGGVLKQSIPPFELSTDKMEKWLSEDGLLWTRETPSVN